MPNPFVHIELYTSNLAKSKEFYSELFQWTLQDIPMPEGGSYTMINVGEGTGGGMMTRPTPDMPPHWLAYIGVDDIKASTEKAKSLGAKVVHDVMEVGEHGWMSILIDPMGAKFALWEPKQA